MANKIWTDEEFEICINLLKNGNSYEYISKELNRTYSSVRSKLITNGFNKSQYKITKKNKECVCLNCDKKFFTKRSKEQKFCSKSCSASFNNKLRLKKENGTIKESIIKENKCLYCNSLLNKNKKFCSSNCFQLFRKNNYYEKIENGDITLDFRQYKSYLIYKYGEKCMGCGWNKINEYTNKIPIELEHIDGNSDNNNLNNLKLLCPNCHSLTKTYKGANVGNGRYKRMERYRNDKSF